MKTIALANQKGGVGKTTLCGLLIQYLCESGTFSFWMISFSYWLPMRLGGILKITQNTSRIRIFGMTF